MKSIQGRLNRFFFLSPRIHWVLCRNMKLTESSTHNFLDVLLSLFFILSSTGPFCSSEVLLLRSEGKPTCLVPENRKRIQGKPKKTSWQSIIKNRAYINVSGQDCVFILTGIQAAGLRPPWRSGWRRSRSRRCWAGPRLGTRRTASPASRGSARRRLKPGRPERSSGRGWPAGSLVKGSGPGWGRAEVGRLRRVGPVGGLWRRGRRQEKCGEAERQPLQLGYEEEARKENGNVLIVIEERISPCNLEQRHHSLLHVVMPCIHLLPPQHLHRHVHGVRGHVGREVALQRDPSSIWAVKGYNIINNSHKLKGWLFK